jgi:hypothetical protein
MAGYVLEQFINGQQQTTLSAGCTNVASTIAVTDATQFPSAPNYRLRIESELLLVTGVSGNTLTVTRGTEGTIAASHSAGAAVLFELTAASVAQVRKDGMAAVVSVLDYAATGNGVTDDATAIGNAIAAAGSNCTVFIPKGTYLCGSLITISNDGVTIQAETGAVMKKNAAAAIFRITGNYCHVIGLEIDGNSKAPRAWRCTGRTTS